MLGSCASAETSVRGSPGPTGPTSANDQDGRARASCTSSGMSSFVATIAPVNTMRGSGSAAIAGSVAPGSSARANSSVSATLGASSTLSDSARIRSASFGALASTRSARAREALLGGAEARRVDQRMRGDVIDAVVDDERGVERVEQHLGLRHVGPQDRPAHAQPARGAAHERRQQPRVEPPRGRARVQRQHQRGEHVQPVRRARRREPPPQALQDALRRRGQRAAAGAARATRRTAPGSRAPGATSGGAGWSRGRCPSRRSRRTRCRGRAGRVGSARRHDPRRPGCTLDVGAANGANGNAAAG